MKTLLPEGSSLAGSNGALRISSAHTSYGCIFTAVIIALLLSFLPTRNVHASDAVISHVVIVSAETNEDIRPLHNDDYIYLSDLPTKEINIRAEVDGSVESVTFSLNGVPRYRYETAAPYALAGDRFGDFHTWKPRIGKNVMTITPSVDGNKGTPLSISFYIKEGSKPLGASAEEASSRAQPRFPVAVEAHLKSSATPSASAISPAPSPEPSITTLQSPTAKSQPTAAPTSTVEPFPIPTVKPTIQPTAGPTAVPVLTPAPTAGDASLPLTLTATATPTPIRYEPTSMTLQDRRFVFTLNSPMVAGSAPAEGKCVAIVKSKSSELTLVCSHSADGATQAWLEDPRIKTPLCEIQSAQSPIVHNCIIHDQLAHSLKENHLRIRIASAPLPNGILFGQVSE